MPSRSNDRSGRRVYIGGLPSGVRERDVDDFFEGFGKIKDVTLKNGYAFIEFDDYRDAEDAVKDLDGKSWEKGGRRVRVEIARDDWKGRASRSGPGGRGFGRLGPRRPPPTRSDYRLLVENVSSRTSWQDLKDYFRKAGEITYTNVHSPLHGDGVVEFASGKGLEYALKIRDEWKLDGKWLKVYDDRRSSRGRRSHSPSRSRSRSRSRRRSRSNSRERSRSRSNRSKSRSRSGSRKRSRSVSRRRSRSTSSKTRDRSRSRSNSRHRSSKKSNEKRKIETKRTDEKDSDESRGRAGSDSDRRKNRSKSRSRTPNTSPKQGGNGHSSKERETSRSKSISK